MAILSNGKFYGFLCSVKETGRQLANGVKEYVEDFVSGFAGHGWKIWEYVKGKWMLEIDSIRVRGQFTVFEMLISKVRAIIGAQTITQGCGKIKNVTLSEDGTAYLITLEDKDMSFMEHDFIRCQEFSGEKRTYHVEVESVTDGMIRIPVSEFEQNEEGEVMNPPSPGDDIVQFGNSSHDEKYVGRHSAIYMHADEGGQPAIDVLDGIYSKDWSNCLKVRMGGNIPESGGLKGLYCVNGMIRGVDDAGHMTYCLYPDGTAEFGDGSAKFNTDRSGHIADGAIEWEWDSTKGKYVCTMKGVVLTWDNLDDETKENLKGEQGKDGLNGGPGTDGKDGMSVYITYNDSEEEPEKPTDDGTTNGWYTNSTASVIWISQKIAESAELGEWSDPIRVKGESGQDATLLPWIEEWNNNKTLIGGEYIVSPKIFSGTNSGTSDNPILTGIAMGKDCLTIPDGTKRTGIFALVDNEIVFELDPINKKYLFKGKIDIANGKILLNEDGTGSLANGNIYWDSIGNVYQRGRIIPIWRYIEYEMEQEGIDTSIAGFYDIDLRKGLYLSVLFHWGNCKIINLPNPSEFRDVIIDLSIPRVAVRETDPFVFVCKTANIYTKDAKVSNVRLKTFSGTLTSSGGVWLADDNFEVNVEI